MSMPKQVARQIAEVEEIELRMVAEQAPPVEPNLAAVPEATNPEPKASEVTAEVVLDQQKEVQVVSEDWQQKYKTLNGMYQAEVPKLHQQVKQLKTQMEQMSFDFEKKAAEPPPKRPSLVTDEEYETFGVDLLDVQRRIVREEQALLDADNKAMREENSKLREQMQRTSNDMSTMSFEKRLHRAVSDFESVNDNPKWVSWLDEFDPLLRAPRRVVAQQAFDSEDVEAISDYVTMFKQTLPTAKVDNRASLEAQVAPSRTGNTGSGNTSQAKIYTTAQADAVFAKMTSLNMKGQYDEAAKLDVEITTAYTEGRVRG